jgi:predicted dehydrogenase
VDLGRWVTSEDVVAVEGLAGPGSTTARLQLADGRSVECCARHGESWAEGLEIDGRRHFVNEPSRWEQLERGLRRLARLPGEDVGGLADMLERWASRVRGEPADGLAGPADAWASVAIIDAYLASVAEGGKPVEVRPPPPGWSN